MTDAELEAAASECLRDAISAGRLPATPAVDTLSRIATVIAAIAGRRQESAATGWLPAAARREGGRSRARRPTPA